MFTTVTLSSRGKPQTVVVGQFKGENLDKVSAGVDPGQWAAWVASKADATGDVGKIVSTYCPDGPERVVVVGLGARESFKPGVLRAAAAALGRFCASAKLTRIGVSLEGALGSLEDVDIADCGRQFGEGLGLISWYYDGLRGKATPDADRGELSVRADDKVFAAGIEDGLVYAAGSNLARSLSQTPPNIATPEFIAHECQKLADETGMECNVIEGEALHEERLTGIFTVGQASENEPCLVRLAYTPEGEYFGKGEGPDAKPVVLVGKTMTYDSGGLSIKVGGGMKGMKRDKDGGCGVIGAMHAIATVVKPPFPVVALLSCAENAISDEAYRPDDVITFRNGVTVEVTNTDAEGRLVLADALCWACELEKPRCIIDMATLTGGVVVALGSAYAGIWCDDNDLRETLEAAGESTGERVWRLPHDQQYKDMMKSPIADIVNSAPVREAHPIQGAAFLSYFCDEKIPWAHIDIAGTHATDKDKGPFIAGPTGFGARLVAEAVRRMGETNDA